jgi:hypothetical protein
LQLAERTAGSASKSSALPNGVKKIADDLMGGEKAGTTNDANQNQNNSNQEGAPEGSQSKPKGGSSESGKKQ